MTSESSTDSGCLFPLLKAGDDVDVDLVGVSTGSEVFDDVDVDLVGVSASSEVSDFLLLMSVAGVVDSSWTKESLLLSLNKLL